jgi:hypothetical protein
MDGASSGVSAPIFDSISATPSRTAESRPSRPSSSSRSFCCFTPLPHPPRIRRPLAAAALCLTVVGRLVLVNDIYKLTGRRLISTVTLWIIAAGFAFVAVLLGLAAAESGGGTRAFLAALVRGAFCVVMIYMIRRRRA